MTITQRPRKHATQKAASPASGPSTVPERGHHRLPISLDAKRGAKHSAGGEKFPLFSQNGETRFARLQPRQRPPILGAACHGGLLEKSWPGNIFGISSGVLLVTKKALPTRALLAAALAVRRSGWPGAQSCRAYLLLVADDELDRELRAKVGPSDLVQETFVAAQQKFDGFAGDSPEELVAWLRGILINKIKDARRHYVTTKRRAIRRELPLEADRPARRNHRTSGPLQHPQPSRGGDRGSRADFAGPIEFVARPSTRHPAAQLEGVAVRGNWPADGTHAGRARALWIRALEQLAKALETSDGQHS